MSAAEFDPFAGPQIVSSIPTTEPQREVWTSAQVGEDANLAYNESVSVRLRGALDVTRLERALAALVERHELLRTTFSDDGLTLVVNAAAEVRLQRHDFAGHPAELKALEQREVETPFDLVQGPLARVHLVKLGAEEHVLVFTAHHIVVDGWSTAVVVGDLARLYSGQTLGPASSFVQWGQQMKARKGSPEARADEAYWLGRFTGEAPVLELPTDRPRPPLKTYASRREDLLLNEALVSRLKKAGAKERASLFAVLLSGFHALLHKLSGQEDVVVGIPAAGQSIGGYDALVGHCVNMLPLRAQVSPEAKVSAFLAEVRRTLLDGQSHQLYTMGQLLQKLPIARDPSRLPLVSVIFNVDRGMAAEAMPFEGLNASLEGNPRAFETYDLFLNAVELQGQVRLECQYNTDLFSAETVRRWLAAYQRLLGSLADALETGGTVAALSVVSDEELRGLEKWNAESALEVDAGLTVVDLLERQAKATPHAVAVESEGRKYTYAQLDARGNAIATKLQALGAGRGKLVGLCVERGVEMIAGVVGVLKSGAGYVPLDPGYPTERLAFMVEDAGIEVLLTEGKVARELKLEAKHSVLVEDVPASAGRVAPSAHPEDVCYVIFTSGSTGKPKGVLVPHRAVVNLLESVKRTPGLSADDTVLGVTTLSFDIAVSEVILPLTVGARIVVASREVAADGARLLDLLRSSQATFLDATPATYRLLLGAGWAGGDLKKCICTGEAMPRDLAVELVKRVPSVWNGYGPTETCVWSTFYEVKAPVGRILIGRPVANTQCHVLDARRQPVLPGCVGELFIGGRGVSLGYLNRPELTRERFIDGAYKTGDLVRLLPDGNLECLGRNDFQVKLRGFRIELGEIEDALTQHPAVRQAACVVREVKPGDPRLLGYLVTHPGKTVSDADLRAHLKKTLPDYMVPQNLVRLERMPLSPAGKIDRKALPQPDLQKAPSNDDFVAPRTETEKGLAKLWQEVLGVARVGATDDFFALGGHSLLASQLLARLRKEQGIALSFRKIFEAPTLEKLAALVDAAKGEAPAVAAAPIPKHPGGPAPLSIHQERLWLLEEMDPAQRRVHSLPAAWRLVGPLDAELLQRAMDVLVDRQASLRTAIRVIDGRPMQVVVPERRVVIDPVDLSAHPREEQQRVTDQLLEELMHKEYDLANDVLVRNVLVRYSAGEHALLTTRHNIVWDGWSFDLFITQMCQIYGALKKGEPSPLGPLPVTFADYAAWHREYVQSAEVQKQTAFWREKLTGCGAPLDMPTDRPRKGSRSHAGANVGGTLPREQGDAINAFAQQHQATTFMVLFSAYVMLLHRYTGQTDLVIGTPVRARTRTELEDVMGTFTNAVLLRVKLDPKWTFTELLAHVRELTLDGFGNQEMPMENLGQQAPMVRALFSFQEARARSTMLGDVEVIQFHAKPPAAANEMMLWTMETPDSLLMMLNYSTDLFEQSTLQRFVEQLKHVLGEVVRDAKRPLKSFPVMPDEELRRVAQLQLGQGGSLEEALGLHSDDAPKMQEALREGIGITDRWVAATESKWWELLDDGVAVNEAIVLGVPSRALREALLKAVPNAWSVFMPAELGRPVAVARVVAGVRRLGGALLPGVDARVVDVNGELTPIGVWGELKVGDVSTHQRVRWLSEGQLELQGRSDGHWEIEGQLADPKALERALEEHPAVAHAAAVLADDPSGRPSVVAFFTAKRGETFTETELRKRVRAVLPAVFVPRRLVELDEMPLTAAGAVDRERLPPPFPKGNAEAVLPRTELEKKVAQRWLEVLRLPVLSVHDNFFDCGGHSLIALQVIEKLFQDTGVRVSPRLLLLGTLESVAAALDGGASKTPAAPRPAVVPVAPPEPVSPVSGLFGKLKDLVRG
ncbi:MAG: amino acid adenylation domain-containing protein [Archangiaceae bacterium]|nr:amino acid adenylation domain-containing protein [Archangiaceae bacterium]